MQNQQVTVDHTLDLLAMRCRSGTKMQQCGEGCEPRCDMGEVTSRYKMNWDCGIVKKKN